MSKRSKVIDRFLTMPKDFTWDELVKVLAHFGYKELKTGKTGGSRRRFVDDDKNIIRIHEPHPGNIVKIYALKDALTRLKETGKINDE